MTRIPTKTFIHQLLYLGGSLLDTDSEFISQEVARAYNSKYLFPAAPFSNCLSSGTGWQDLRTLTVPLQAKSQRHRRQAGRRHISDSDADLTNRLAETPSIKNEIVAMAFTLLQRRWQSDYRSVYDYILWCCTAEGRVRALLLLLFQMEERTAV